MRHEQIIILFRFLSPVYYLHFELVCVCVCVCWHLFIIWIAKIHSLALLCVKMKRASRRRRTRRNKTNCIWNGSVFHSKMWCVVYATVSPPLLESAWSLIGFDSLAGALFTHGSGKDDILPLVSRLSSISRRQTLVECAVGGYGREWINQLDYSNKQRHRQESLWQSTQ